MENQFLRLLLVMLLLYLLTADLQEYLQMISGPISISIASFVAKWNNPENAVKTRQGRYLTEKPGLRMGPMGKEVLRAIAAKRQLSEPPEPPVPPKPPVQDNLESNQKNQPKEPIPFFTSLVPSDRTRNSRGTRKLNKIKPEELLGTLTDEEQQELKSMKSQMTNIMHEWCLPKLVCELHASLGGRDSLSDAEKGLLTIIKESNMNPVGEITSRYHFAAHMGQLLANVEGNGCHNLYSGCPLSGPKVLQMVKKVRTNL